ncbi:MAG: DUF448 domain-containing protein [Magnetococcales bacterium]|nr:DUF448 domain-containing protein [Magnetococcales bacterium]
MKSDQPVRTCAVSRKSGTKNQLLRFVVGPDGLLVEDLAGKLPGRGRYVVPTRHNLANLFKRSGLRGAAVEARLDRIGAALSRRLLDGISLSRRGGQLRWGLRAVQELVSAAVAGPNGHVSPMLWLLATDTATHTREKLDQQRRKLRASVQVDPEIHELLDRSCFGTLCGGGDVALLIVLGGGMVERVRADVFRLQTFLTQEMGKSTGNREPDSII